MMCGNFLQNPIKLDFKTLERIMTNKPVDPTVENEFKDQNLKYNRGHQDQDMYRKVVSWLDNGL